MCSIGALVVTGACTVEVQPIRFLQDAGTGQDVPSVRVTDGSTSRDSGGKCVGYVPVETDAARSLAQGLLVHYTCEQASGTTLPDTSGNSRHATLAGSTSGGFSFVEGKVGKALSLNVAAEAHVVLPTGLLTGSCEATVATWVLINSQTTWQRIWTFSTGGSVYMYLTSSNIETNSIRSGITLNANIDDAQQFLDAPFTLPVAVWKHIAVVLGPMGMVLYVDGAKVATNPSATLRPADLGKTTLDYIGRSNYSWDSYLDGKIDEFRVYNRALSPQEISALFTGQTP